MTYKNSNKIFQNSLKKKGKTMLTWKDVISFSVKGNPEPDRRVVKTEAEWRELLTTRTIQDYA